jgi:hypothetical protein
MFALVEIQCFLDVGGLSYLGHGHPYDDMMLVSIRSWFFHVIIVQVILLYIVS